MKCNHIFGFYSSRRDWHSRKHSCGDTHILIFRMLLIFLLLMYNFIVNYPLSIHIHRGGLCSGYFISIEMPFQTADFSIKTHLPTSL